MFAIKTESIKSYVETPKSLLKEHHNLIALIADNGNHFLAYGIVEGTTLYIDLDAEYEENTLLCFINKQGHPNCLYVSLKDMIMSAGLLLLISLTRYRYATGKEQSLCISKRRPQSRRDLSSPVHYAGGRTQI